MKTLIDRRRAQPFRDYLDSPSWLGDEPKKVPLTRGQNIAKQIAWKFCVVLFWVAVVILLIAEVFLF